MLVDCCESPDIIYRGFFMRHTFRAVALVFLHKQYDMTRFHQSVYFFQFGLLVSSALGLQFFGFSINQTLAVFGLIFISEIILVYQQSKMSDQEIYYRKSCLFAMGDLSAALVYSGYFIFLLLARIFKFSIEYSSLPIVILFTYTLLRKIFIFKNYTYEK